MFETLNGRAVSWAEASISCNVAGGVAMQQIDIKSVTHESAVEVGIQRGVSGGRTIKRTTGQITNTGSVTFYRDGNRDFKKVLSAAALTAGYVNADGHVQLSLVRFDIIIVHSWLDDPEIYTRKLLYCRYLKDGSKSEEGTEAETVEVDVNPLRIVEVVNGTVETVLL